jgi:hypothetical protein
MDLDFDNVINDENRIAITNIKLDLTNSKDTHRVK